MIMSIGEILTGHSSTHALQVVQAFNSSIEFLETNFLIPEALLFFDQIP